MKHSEIFPPFYYPPGVHYFSFVCSNEEPESVLQIVLTRYEQKDDAITPYIIPRSRKSLDDIKDPRLKKLEETLLKLQGNSFDENQESIKLSKSAIDRELDLEFFKKLSEANQGGFTLDLLDFHFSRFQGVPNDFINHLKERKYDLSPSAKLWIEKQVPSPNRSKEKQEVPINNKLAIEDTHVSKNKLSIVEKLILVEILQKIELFPKEGSGLLNTQKQTNTLISLLTGISSENEVKKTRLKVSSEVFSAKLTTGQLPQKMTNLNNLLHYTEELKIPALRAELDKLKSKIKEKGDKK